VTCFDAKHVIIKSHINIAYKPVNQDNAKTTLLMFVIVIEEQIHHGHVPDTINKIMSLQTYVTMFF
jgi:hypothetical protein